MSPNSLTRPPIACGFLSAHSLQIPQQLRSGERVLVDSIFIDF